MQIAPTRETLNKYGGPLSIEEYHNVTKHHQVVEIYKLPLIPITIHIGEISRSTSNPQTTMKSHTSKPRKYIPLDPLKMNQAVENVRAKNDSLLKNCETIDKCLKSHMI